MDRFAPKNVIKIQAEDGTIWDSHDTARRHNLKIHLYKVLETFEEGESLTADGFINILIDLGLENVKVLMKEDQL